MLQPEKLQVEICLLKTNMNEIQHDLDAQSMTVPVIYKELEKKYRYKCSILEVDRAVSEELERLNLENLKRVAASAKVRRLLEDIVEANESAAESRDELSKAFNQKEDEMDMIVYEFGDSLYEKAERFRKSHRYYNTEEVNKETEEVNNVLAELKETHNKKQNNFERLRALWEATQPYVDENFHLNVDNLRGQKKALGEMMENLKEELQALQKHI